MPYKTVEPILRRLVARYDFPLAKKDYKKLQSRIIYVDHDYDNEDTMFNDFNHLRYQGTDPMTWLIDPVVNPDETQINKLFNEGIILIWTGLILAILMTMKVTPKNVNAMKGQKSDFKEVKNFSFKKKGNENIRKGSVINW